MGQAITNRAFGKIGFVSMPVLIRLEDPSSGQAAIEARMTVIRTEAG